MKRMTIICSLVLIVALLAGCTVKPVASPNTTAALSANNINLIFVVSPDLAYQAPGDVNADTANLSNQGLQRSLLMATYLKQQVLGTKNVNRIYALEPMTHLQTAKNLPDMAAIGYIQQFAMLNQIPLTALGGYGSLPAGRCRAANTPFGRARRRRASRIAMASAQCTILDLPMFRLSP